MPSQHRKMSQPIQRFSEPLRIEPFIRSFPMPLEEWYVILESRPNILIRADKSRLEQTMFALMPHLRQEVIQWRAGMKLELPKAFEGTLVVEGLEKLSPAEWQALDDWLTNSTSRVQVISSTAEDPMHLMTTCGFPVSLYYRLNTVVLDLMRP